MEELKFCKHCGEKIFKDAVTCPKCGRQVEEIYGQQGIIINNSTSASSSAAASATASVTASAVHGERRCSKWVAFCLCLFLGFLGGHKFYEGKIGFGVLYLFTGGLFLIGWIVDIFNILGKSDPYFVRN